MSLSEAEDMGIIASVPQEIRFRSFHIVLPNGQIRSGAQALPDLVRQLPFGSLSSTVAASAPFGATLLNFLYAALSRLHREGLCRHGVAISQSDS